MMTRLFSAISKACVCKCCKFFYRGRGVEFWVCIVCFCHVLLYVLCSFKRSRVLSKFYFVHFVGCFFCDHFELVSLPPLNDPIIAHRCCSIFRSYWHDCCFGEGVAFYYRVRLASLRSLDTNITPYWSENSRELVLSSKCQHVNTLNDWTAGGV